MKKSQNVFTKTKLVSFFVAGFIAYNSAAISAPDHDYLSEDSVLPKNHFQSSIWIDDIIDLPAIHDAEARDQILEEINSLKKTIKTGTSESIPSLTQEETAQIIVAENKKQKTNTLSFPQTSSGKTNSLSNIQKMISAGQYAEASSSLFNMAKNPQFADSRAQIEYILGWVLYEMKMYQTAAFVFYDVVRIEGKNTKSRFLRQSLQKLSLAGDALDSDLLLKFAVSQISESDFPESERDVLYYRLGEVRLQEKKFHEAIQLFSRVQPTSRLYSKARYNLGLAHSEAGELDAAIASYDDLTSTSKANLVTDKNRVNSLLAKARAMYQKKDWSSAAEMYREIPRDTEAWHESLFELSWTLLRMAKFRTALSNFHSLHSPYYDDFYQPESLLLRGIVYLYICRYDEMDKTLDLFEKIYKPVQTDIRNALEGDRNPMFYYREITRVADNFDAMKAKNNTRQGLKLPFIAARQILKEGDVRKAQNYVRKLNEERKRISQQKSNWQNSPVGLYAKRLVEKRVDASKAFIGKLARRHLILMQVDLRDLFEQVGFLRFEGTSGKKEVVKKEIQGKSITKTRVDEDSTRDYFIQNGYEYWPFKGEYWLNEIGNYHYVGVQACE